MRLFFLEAVSDGEIPIDQATDLLDRQVSVRRELVQHLQPQKDDIIRLRLCAHEGANSLLEELYRFRHGEIAIGSEERGETRAGEALAVGTAYLIDQPIREEIQPIAWLQPQRLEGGL